MSLGLCGAKTRQREGTCMKPSGWGTDHVGTGYCRLHGGNTTSHRVKAAQKQALEALASVDVPTVEPHEALRRMVDLGSAQVDALALMLRGLIERADEKQPVDTLDLRVHLHELQKSMDRLVTYSKVALDAKVEERALDEMERRGALWADAIGVLLDGFGLRDDPRAPELVRGAFRVLEGGKAA